MLSFLKSCKILPVENSVAASQATTVGEIIDTAGFGGACFIYKLGAVTDAGAVTLKIYQGTDATVSDVAELSGQAPRSRSRPATPSRCWWWTSSSRASATCVRPS